MSGSRIEPCRTPHDNSPGDEVSFPMLTKKVWLVRYFFSGSPGILCLINV